MILKRCFRCGVTKSLGLFYRHPSTADGHLGKCKLCTRRDVAENREAKHEYYAAVDRERAKLPHRVEQRKAYRASEAGRSAAANAQRIYRRNLRTFG